MKGQWAITVNGNWRLIFAFEGTDAVLVDYRDYHYCKSTEVSHDAHGQPAAPGRGLEGISG
ncbi:type II toxin-antitoxin system RelE/ParE family toxin [Acinetobacter baumannii]